MELPVYDMSAKEAGSIKIPDTIIAEKIDRNFLYEVIKYYLANKRVGSASTKNRAEVSGGGRKPWRQKHTGRARHGSIRSPLWRGGGVVFGPKPRDYSLDMPREKLRLALSQVLTQRIKDNAVYVFDVFKFSESKTSNFINLLKSLNIIDKKLVVVLSEVNDETLKSMRNYPYVKYVAAKDVNAYDVINAEVIIVDKASFDIIAKRLEDK
ncbi:MAG: 50S ribosomal protein L4 [Elusimicrobiales bacterium]